MLVDYEYTVVSGQLVLLPKDLPPQIKLDILNSQLYAQLYASLTSNKFSDPMAWDERLTKARSELKWATRFSLSRRPELADGATLDATSLLMEQFAHAPHFDRPVMEEAIRLGLKALAHPSPAQELFFDSVLRVTQAGSSLKIGPVSDVLLHVCVVSHKAHLIDVQLGFSLRGALDHLLFEHPYPGKDVSGPMSLSVSETELDTLAYSWIRDKVKDGLGAEGVKRIMSLDLPTAVITPDPLSGCCNSTLKDARDE